MSYQVLARKWRPRNFSEMVGQEHVLRALVNALDNNRLHHAYLFTGTRGVGKTTIARILAKCLNCEQGVSSTPCGTCSACVSIAEGRFVDLIEVDAASRTKVEDTRELLENVQYAPTAGRYKVYLIDEVHMLSGHSFNALLKTLEEPPPHVKFLLATTDPQKLPVTILSRCLQFNLKNLSPERIVEHLQFVLGEEQVPSEEAGLWALARAADGSMRDALSLTDQAISHGGGKITEAEVNGMLGSIDLTAIADIARALANRDGSEVLAVVDRMAEHAPDYGTALGDLLSVWHRVAIAQTVPDALDNRHGDYQLVQELAKALSPEDVQLFYQIALLGRRDLPLAPEPRLGFEMALLRTLAFRPQSESGVEPPVVTVSSPSRAAGEGLDPAKKPEPLMAVTDGHRSGSVSEAFTATVETPTEKEAAAGNDVLPGQPVAPTASHSGSTAEIAAKASTPETTSSKATAEVSVVDAVEPSFEPADSSAGFPDLPEPPLDCYEEQREIEHSGGESQLLSTDTLLSLSRGARMSGTQDVIEHGSVEADDALASGQKSALSSEHEQQRPHSSLDEVRPEHWLDIYQHLQIGGLLQNTAANLALVELSGQQLHFVLDINNSTLYEEGHQQRLAEVLQQYFNQPVTVVIEVGAVLTETPQVYLERLRQQRQQAAVESLRDNPQVRRITDMFDGVLLENTIKPLD
ncbi:MAG: DNA polymerase III subunit gamma/tau [Gammaproteobacteria bacterium]|nr:MAG: DNA polymerase III subunit gamma/tau [Gammaproteobacteria bacterium]